MKVRGVFDPGWTTHFALVTQTFIESPPRVGYSSRYLRYSREQGRWGNELEEGEQRMNRTLWGSKERPLGRRTRSEPWMGRSLPCENREEETPREQQLSNRMWLQFSDTDGMGSLLGQDHVGS